MVRRIIRSYEHLCISYIIQVHAVIGVLTDDTDPMVSVMKLEKAPQETYADIGGLDTQIQEIKASDILYLPVSHDIM